VTFLSKPNPLMVQQSLTRFCRCEMVFEFEFFFNVGRANDVVNPHD